MPAGQAGEALPVLLTACVRSSRSKPLPCWAMSSWRAMQSAENCPPAGPEHCGLSHKARHCSSTCPCPRRLLPGVWGVQGDLHQEEPLPCALGKFPDITEPREYQGPGGL